MGETDRQLFSPVINFLSSLTLCQISCSPHPQPSPNCKPHKHLCSLGQPESGYCVSIWVDGQRELLAREIGRPRMDRCEGPE